MAGAPGGDDDDDDGGMGGAKQHARKPPVSSRRSALLLRSRSSIARSSADDDAGPLPPPAPPSSGGGAGGDDDGARGGRDEVPSRDEHPRDPRYRETPHETPVKQCASRRGEVCQKDVDPSLDLIEVDPAWHVLAVVADEHARRRVGVQSVLFRREGDDVVERTASPPPAPPVGVGVGGRQVLQERVDLRIADSPVQFQFLGGVVESAGGGGGRGGGEELHLRAVVVAHDARIRIRRRRRRIRRRRRRHHPSIAPRGGTEIERIEAQDVPNGEVPVDGIVDTVDDDVVLRGAAPT